jgi:hypothetical protein
MKQLLEVVLAGYYRDRPGSHLDAASRIPGGETQALARSSTRGMSFPEQIDICPLLTLSVP